MNSTVSRSAITAAVLAAGALCLGGCATEKYVNTHVAASDAKLDARIDATASETHTQIDALQGHLHDTDSKLAGVDKTSREALDRAQAAGKLAEGKFVYEMVLSDDAVKFPAAGTALSPEAEARLTDFVQKLKAENRNVYLEIQGYTDATGSAAANLRLGEERAEAVRRFLSKAGVALNRMATISYGADDPVAPNKTRAGRAQNRRVVLVVLA